MNITKISTAEVVLAASEVDARISGAVLTMQKVTSPEQITPGSVEDLKIYMTILNGWRVGKFETVIFDGSNMHSSTISSKI